MKLKQYVRYEINFQCKWALACAFFIGLSFFLRIAYYFGLVNLQDCGAGEIILQLILPLLFCGGFIVLFRALKWNSPGLFAILGSVLCLLLMIWNFSSGDVLRIILSILGYAGAALVLLATAGGYLPGTLVASFVFGVILLVRICSYSLNQDALFDYFLEISSLSAIASLFALIRCFRPHIRSTENI